jgi:DNA-binding HxlR family transcriptional regulator
MPDPDAFLLACPSRGLVARLGEKWSLLALVAIGSGTDRFGALKRRLQGVSAKMLTRTLRTLERDGLVARAVVSTRPFVVTYALTPLGATLLPHAQALKRWAEQNLAVIESANDRYDLAGR